MFLKREGRALPGSMASGLLERMSGLDEEAAAQEEEFSKDAIAAAYAGKSIFNTLSFKI